mmetsp:Transcript_10659/g.19451  ORF Transcript_10659/g.19451 Transcript_10659/m.19451 type:complete len:91 (-) Transcript_10659:1559-1831(-)
MHVYRIDATSEKRSKLCFGAQLPLSTRERLSEPLSPYLTNRKRQLFAAHTNAERRKNSCTHSNSISHSRTLTKNSHSRTNAEKGQESGSS